jgi:tetratricopeptide (TPR) repeat protein
MATREEIEMLIQRGYYDDALSRIEELEDPIEKVKLLTDLAVAIQQKGGPEEWIPGLIEDAMYIAKKLKDPSLRAMAYSIIASALGIIGYEEDAMDFFGRAIDETDDVSNPLEKGIVLSNIAYHLAVGGYPDNALDVFNVAFDTIIGAEMTYTYKVDGVIRIGELMERAGDRLPAGKALDFYQMAFDIFDKLHVNQRAAIVEKKIELAKTVYDVGLPEIRESLLEGRYHYAIVLIEKKYRGTARLIGELEVALWMKRTNNIDYLEVVDKAFERCGNPVFTEANVQKIAKLLTELGSLKRAMEFAREIKDPRKKSEALKAIAVELAKRREFDEAREVVESIPDPRIKAEALTEIATMEESM